MAEVHAGSLVWSVKARLEAEAKILADILKLKVENPFGPLANNAKKAKPTLTDLGRQIRSYGNQINQTTGLQKTQALTTDQAISKLKSLTGEVSQQMRVLDASGDEYGQLATLLNKAAVETIKLEAAQVRSQKAFDVNRVRGYRDAQNFLRTEYERGAIEVAEYIACTQVLQTEMVEARGTFRAASAELGALDRVIGTTARGIQTAEGSVSRLGLSQQVVLGHSRGLTTQFGNMQTAAIAPLLGGFGPVGLVRATGGFVGEAQRGRICC